MERKKLDELNALDDFMFNKLIMHETKGEWFCKILLETILGTRIRNLRVMPQKTLQGIDTDKHGIRMDAYIEAYQEEGGAQITDVELQPDIYDLEPTLYPSSSEERRTRFYHALIDSKLLDSGFDYLKLRNVTLIIILNYDPFGLNRMVYTVKRQCVEEPDMPFHDGSTAIYLYTRGKKDIPSQTLKDMLQFLENSTENNVTNENLEEIHQLMNQIKHDKEVGISYMHTWEREMLLKEEGHSAGLREGLLEGQASGIIKTCQEFGTSKEATCDKIQKALSLSKEEALQYIQRYWITEKNESI